MAIHEGVVRAARAGADSIAGMPAQLQFGDIVALVFEQVHVEMAGVGVLLLVRNPLYVSRAVNITPTSHRQLRMFKKAKIHSSIFLSALKAFSDVSRSTPKCGRPRK